MGWSAMTPTWGPWSVLFGLRLLPKDDYGDNIFSSSSQVGCVDHHHHLALGFGGGGKPPKMRHGYTPTNSVMVCTERFLCNPLTVCHDSFVAGDIVLLDPNPPWLANNVVLMLGDTVRGMTLGQHGQLKSNADSSVAKLLCGTRSNNNKLTASARRQ